VCVCVYVYIYIYIYVCVYVYVCLYVCLLLTCMGLNIFRKPKIYSKNISNKVKLFETGYFYLLLFLFGSRYSDWAKE
jgi:hypothetical protein